MNEILPAKPRLRGRLHQVAFWLSIPAGLTLVTMAQGAVARIGGAIYALSLSGLYASSAAFHRIPWSPKAWNWMRRLDHSMIFVLIAGTYTPFALLALRPPWSTAILWIAWAGAAVGIALRLLFPRLSAIQNTLYLGLGWVAVVTLPVMIETLGLAGVALLFAGGLFYTVGAILFLMRKPDPKPTVFGYHEVWHSMVIGGSLCHYALVVMLVV
jgi:hemolysin III